jgi:hypothetical protein
VIDGSRSDSVVTARLGPWGKAVLAVRIWRRFLLVRALLPREPLPEVIRCVGRPLRRDRRRLSPRLLSRAVHRSLHIGSRRPTCLVSSLVLFRLLREQGDSAEVVIGLPAAASSKNAHAWVELQRVDIGPPPGRGTHQPMARFG